MPVRTLTDDANPCGESPIWDAAHQLLYWTDCSGKLYSYNWNTKRRKVVLTDHVITGCALDHSGGLTLINSRGVWFWNGTDKPIHLAKEANGAKLQLNDCLADPSGRLLAGSCFYDPTAVYPLGNLFSVHTDGKVHILDEGFHLANGLGFSPDHNTLYATDSVARLIYAYDYDLSAGRVTNRRVFVTIPSTEGLPDGLTVDAQGFVWSAQWYGGCICRYDPDGTLERRIEIPAKQTSSLAFGGPDLTDIFVTSAAKSETTPVMPPRYDPTSGYFGGALFHLASDISGRPEHKTNFAALANLRTR